MTTQEFTTAAVAHDDVADLKDQYQKKGLDFDGEVKEVVERHWFIHFLQDAGGKLFDLALQVLKGFLSKKLDQQL